MAVSYRHRYAMNTRAFYKNVHSTLQMFPLNPSAIVPSGPLISDLDLEMAQSEISSKLSEDDVYHFARLPANVM